jgi:hypothetical protein
MPGDPHLHLYSPQMWHDEAFIVANMQGLLSLRKAIDDAILNGHGSAFAFVGDGEGFHTIIAKVEDKDFDTLAVPYSDEDAKENRETAVRPWTFPEVKKAIKEAES